MAAINAVLRSGIYATVAVLILTLTGVFAEFEDRDVIVDTLSLNTVVLAIMLIGTGIVMAGQARKHGGTLAQVAAILGGLIPGLALAGLVLFNIAVRMGEVFPNISSLNRSPLTFGQTIQLNPDAVGTWLVERTAPLYADLVALPALRVDGLLILLAVSVLCSVIATLALNLPERLRGFSPQLADRGNEILITSAGLVVVMGLVTNQINETVTLPDALLLAGVFGGGYVFSLLRPLSAESSPLTLPLIGELSRPLAVRAVLGFLGGVAVGVVLVFIAGAGGLDEGGVLRGIGTEPQILGMANDALPLPFLIITGLIGLTGVLAAQGSSLMSNGSLYFLGFILALGILNWQDEMTLLAAGLIFVMLALLSFFAPLAGEGTAARFDAAKADDRRATRLIFTMVTLGVLVVVPQFVNLYVANVFNLIALYVIMGIGLNVMIGYTGLLDLGYVASFAIGAYTLGVLTAPNILTCNGVDPGTIPFNEIAETCTNTLTFWQAWPICVLMSALTGMALGIPVLGLRGDYLAIVTLGFGEITNRIIRSDTAEPLLGGAQGVSPIPTPILNLTDINAAWFIDMNQSTSIYYLYLISVGIAAFVVWRLVNSRLGRAWRAIRADEDVAEAMGIHLVRYKLMAFGVSSAFAGLGGAVFGAQLQGIFPNSFTILVSINVLSLIIMGGMGSIPGVVLGAMILVGLPELLRELEAYRLLGFGALLVVVMLTRPQGLLPPTPARLSEKAKPTESSYPLRPQAATAAAAAPINEEDAHGSA